MTGLEFIEKKYIAPKNPFARELKRARLEKGVSINQVAEYGKFYGKVNHGGAVTNWERGYNIPSKEQWGKLCEYLPISRQEYEELRQEYEELRRPYNNKHNLQEIIECKNAQGYNTKIDHETVKPLQLIGMLLETTARKDSLVLDTFMGSWTTGRACLDLGLNFIGFELNPDYCHTGEERLKQQSLFSH